MLQWERLGPAGLGQLRDGNMEGHGGPSGHRPRKNNYQLKPAPKSDTALALEESGMVQEPEILALKDMPIPPGLQKNTTTWKQRLMRTRKRRGVDMLGLFNINDPEQRKDEEEDNNYTGEGSFLTQGDIDTKDKKRVNSKDQTDKTSDTGSRSVSDSGRQKYPLYSDLKDDHHAVTLDRIPVEPGGFRWPQVEAQRRREQFLESIPDNPNPEQQREIIKQLVSEDVQGFREKVFNLDDSWKGKRKHPGEILLEGLPPRAPGEVASP